MPCIEAMYCSPVKSLALAAVERARLEKAGIPGDRAFFIAGDGDKLVTQREHFPLVQVKAAYDASCGELVLTFPDGDIAAGVPEPGEPITVPFFDERPVEGNVMVGPFGEALSAFAGRPLRLVRAAPGQAFDGYPISMCSFESLGALADAAGVPEVDGRRFRQNVYISGVPTAHGEDGWIGGTVRIGSAVARVKRKDSRCVITTRDPDTGEHDMNTLKIIAKYRKDDEDDDVNFGVYCTIIEPGEASVGDEVTALEGTANRRDSKQ